jgi:hypothetical protein
VVVYAKSLHLNIGKGGGREEDQRRPGGGQLWKRHREKEGRGRR